MAIHRLSRPVRHVVVAAALGALLTPVDPATAAAPARLARTNVITASRSASVPVVLTRAATVTVNRGTASSSNVAISGRGRVAGFDLRAADGSTAPPHLFASLTNGCYTRGCAPREQHVATVVAGFRGTAQPGGLTRYTLPAGRYVLLLVADGAPVTVKLRLDGLSGSTTLRPAGRADVRWDPLEPNLDPAPAPARFVYSAPAGALPVGDDGGMLFTVFDVRLSAGDFGERGFCYYPNTGDRVYVSQCPGGKGSSGQSVTGPILAKHTLRAINFTDGEAAATTGSVGVYYDNVGVVETIDALSVRIAY